jgi:hypothetical protein
VTKAFGSRAEATAGLQEACGRRFDAFFYAGRPFGGLPEAAALPVMPLGRLPSAMWDKMIPSADGADAVVLTAYFVRVPATVDTPLQVKPVPPFVESI